MGAGLLWQEMKQTQSVHICTQLLSESNCMVRWSNLTQYFQPCVFLVCACQQGLFFFPPQSLPSPSFSSWLLGCLALISIIKSTWGMNIQGITFLIPIPVLSSIFPSMHAAKIASAWRWELMDNQEGMVNRGHRTKYYLRAQYAVTQLTFLQGNSNISLRANEWCASFPLLNCSLIETKHEKGCKYF